MQLFGSQCRRFMSWLQNLESEEGMLTDVIQGWSCTEQDWTLLTKSSTCKSYVENLRMTTISCIETLWFFVALEAFCTLCFFFLHRTSSFWSSHSGTRWSGIGHHPKLFANVVTWLHSIALVTRAFREAAGFISTASKDGWETWWCCWQSRKYRWFVKGESVELDSCLANRNVPNSENIGDFPLAFQYLRLGGASGRAFDANRWWKPVMLLGCKRESKPGAFCVQGRQQINNITEQYCICQGKAKKPQQWRSDRITFSRQKCQS